MVTMPLTLPFLRGDSCGYGRHFRKNHSCLSNQMHNNRSNLKFALKNEGRKWSVWKTGFYLDTVIEATLVCISFVLVQLFLYQLEQPLGTHIPTQFIYV